MDFLTHTWHWSISGFIIGMVMLALIYFGKVFGMSSNLRSLCAMTGIGKQVPFFDWDWKSQRWNLVVIVGAMIGGYVATHYLNDSSNVSINPITIQKLQKMRIDAPNSKLLPDAIFREAIFQSPKKIFLLINYGLKSVLKRKNPPFQADSPSNTYLKHYLISVTSPFASNVLPPQSYFRK